MMNDRLVFDIGMYKGQDAAFYLAKGFDVVSVEAYAAHVEAAKDRFSGELATGRWTIIEKAVAEGTKRETTLFVNRCKDDSHTTIVDLAADYQQKSRHEFDRIVVPTTDLASLFDSYGVPYYLKCDIEGGDDEVLTQLVRDDRRPPFISFEAGYVGIPAKMRAAGYKLFQVRNQWRNPLTSCPVPPREGVHASVPFTGHMSGLFGRELPAAKWMAFEDALRLFLAWQEIHRLDSEFVPCWCDFHATILSQSDLREPHLFA